MKLGWKGFSLLFSLTVTVVVLLPATAAMAVYTPVGGMTVTDTRAGTHPNPTMTMTQSANTAATCTALGCPEPDTKTIVQTFPKGFLADPNAAPYCDPTSTAIVVPGQVQWSCPANTQVGSQVITAVVCGTSCAASSINTTVYNVAPGTPNTDGSVVSEIGHLASISEIAGTNIPNARLDVNISLQGGDTMVSTADNLPQTTAVDNATGAFLGCTDVGGIFRACNLHIVGIAFTLFGTTGEASGHPFITMPTFCSTNSFSATHTSYDTSETATNTVDFPVTNCEILDFSPSFDLSLSTTKRGAAPAVVGNVTQSANEAAVKDTTITFPGGFKVNQDTTLTACSAAQQGTGQTTPTCGSDSRMGWVSATAPQIPPSYGPEYGDVFLGENAGDPEFNIIPSLNGFFPLVVRGDIDVEADSLNFVNTFRDLPAATMTGFTLSLAGGGPGILSNPIYCAPQTITAQFTAHSGHTASADKTVNITGCRSPRLGVTLNTQRVGAHPIMTLDTSSTGTVLKRVTQRLPYGMRWKGRNFDGGSRVLGRVWLTTAKGTEKVKLKHDKSSQTSRRGQVRLKGTRTDGTEVTAFLFRRKGGRPIITMTGLPSVTDLLVGTKLRLYGDRLNWLTLPQSCRRMKFSVRATDAYNKAKRDARQRDCKG